MLRFRVHMTLEPETSEEAARALRSLIGPVRAEAGCCATRLLRDADNGCALTWVEEWRSEEDFEDHLRSSSFRQIVAVMELASATPAVEIDNVASRRGFELVEEILAEDHRLTVREA